LTKLTKPKNKISNDKVENETKVQSLTEAINVERMKNEENDKAQKELLKKNVDLEKIFKN
jgi:hypothetical protein